MTKVLEKFTKDVKNLKDYYILKETNTYLTVGTLIGIKKCHEVNNNVFQPYSKNIDVDIYTAFIILLKKECPDLAEFKKNKIPILILPQKVLYGKDENITTKEHLDHFVETKIIMATSYYI